MTNGMTGDAAALAQLVERLAGADLVGFGIGSDRLVTAKVGQGKGPPEEIPSTKVPLT